MNVVSCDRCAKTIGTEGELRFVFSLRPDRDEYWGEGCWVAELCQDCSKDVVATARPLPENFLPADSLAERIAAYTAAAP